MSETEKDLEQFANLKTKESDEYGERYVDADKLSEMTEEDKKNAPKTAKEAIERLKRRSQEVK